MRRILVLGVAVLLGLAGAGAGLAATAVPNAVSTGPLGPWIASGSSVYPVDVSANRLERPPVRVPGRVFTLTQNRTGLWVVSSRGVFRIAPGRRVARRVAATRGPLVPGRGDVSARGDLWVPREDQRLGGSPAKVVTSFRRNGDVDQAVIPQAQGVAGLALARGKAWVAVIADRAPRGRLIAFDETSLRVSGSWRLPGLPAAIARAGTSLWIAVRPVGQDRFRLFVFDTVRRTLRPGSGVLSGEPAALDIAGRQAWIATDRAVIRFDVVRGRYIGQSRLQFFPSAVSAGSSWGWVKTRQGLVRISARTGSVARAPAPFDAPLSVSLPCRSVDQHSQASR